MFTFAEKVIRFHQDLVLKTDLPPNIKSMNPYKNNALIQDILHRFYTQFFADHHQRKLIVGINPGRFGAGMTGIPFTDTKRLAEFAKLKIDEFESHEPSSVFVYEVIEAFGGVEKFYRHYYINSVCPLGFLRKNKKGNYVNYNYYDDPSLFEAVKPFIISSLKKQIDFGIDTSQVFSMGKKNAVFLDKINRKEKLFKEIIALPHPRYVVQYQYKQKQVFVEQYLQALI